MSDQQQFEKLFQRSRRRAHALAHRLTGNAADAEDITQDAYIRAWHNFGSYDATRSFEAWLFRIITNRARDLCRRQKRTRIYSLDAPIHAHVDGQLTVCECAAPAANPEEIIIAPILEERLEASLLALPSDYRAALLLCHVEQQSYQEIATRMHCPLGTVRSRIHRARRLLRLYMQTDAGVRTLRSPPTALQPSTTVP